MRPGKPLSGQWLGRLGYRWAWRLQRLRRSAILRGEAPEAMWLLEHEAVITTGRRQVEDLPDAETLRARGVEVVRTERGGLATWHGPGQLVGYLLIDLNARDVSVRCAVTAMEQGLIDWMSSLGIQAARREGYPGVWVGSDKVAALGLHIRKGVTMHGFALNLCPDLSGFGLITPCGVTDGSITSVEVLCGTAPKPHEAASSVGQAMVNALRAAPRRSRCRA